MIQHLLFECRYARFLCRALQSVFGIANCYSISGNLKVLFVGFDLERCIGSDSRLITAQWCHEHANRVHACSTHYPGVDGYDDVLFSSWMVFCFENCSSVWTFSMEVLFYLYNKCGLIPSLLRWHRIFFFYYLYKESGHARDILLLWCLQATNVRKSFIRNQHAAPK